jgi:hypothetical protein
VPIDRDLAPGHVQPQRADLEHVVVGADDTPQQRPQPRQELFELERLGHVVVGSGVESFDPIGELVSSGEHQDRRPVAVLPEATAHGEPVDVRHHDVQHDHVGPVILDGFEGGRSIGDAAGGVPLVTEDPLEGHADLGVVLSDEDLRLGWRRFDHDFLRGAYRGSRTPWERPHSGPP